MNHDDKKRSADGGTSHPDTPTGEALLRAEIGFWREMLSDCDEACPPDSVERMRQALALAEHRLMLLLKAPAADGPSSIGPGRTSRPGECFLH
jgi:hypothetical protein